MIPFEEFKKALGPGAKNLTDEEIKKIRDLEYQFAAVLFDLWLKERNQDINTQDND